jgi:hypothetical protein
MRKFIHSNKKVDLQIKKLMERLNAHDVQLNADDNTTENLLDEKVESKKWEERVRIGINNKRCYIKRKLFICGL